MKKTTGSILMFTGFVFALFQWWQIFYRIFLFVSKYDCKYNVNHIGNGDFFIIYIFNFLMILFEICSFALIWRTRKIVKNLAIISILGNILGCISFYIMHKMGILVEYAEFIRSKLQ